MFLKVNPCWVFPCERGGTCQPYGLNYTCSCRKFSYGNNCQFFRDPNANNSTILNYASMKNLRSLINLPSNKSIYLLYQASFHFNTSIFEIKIVSSVKCPVGITRRFYLTDKMNCVKMRRFLSNCFISECLKYINF